MKKLVFFVASTILAATAAQADTVYNTELANLNGPTWSTTTDAHGTVTTSSGARIGATPVANKWEQESVGGGASVGITTDYARSGNGSAYFNSVSGSSKADLEYYLNQPVALSSFQGASYDWYRDGSSTNASFQVPSLRMLIGNAAGVYQGYLIYEPIYNELTGPGGNQPAPTNSWQTSSITLDSRYWSNGGSLLTIPSGTSPCPDCYGSLASWISANPNATILGFSTGVGSGWNGTFTGAVDNISFTLGGNTTAWNFEVAAAVPEPASWAMMIGGFGLVGGAMRRRRQDDLVTA